MRNWLALSAAIIIVDQATKYAALHYLTGRPAVEVTSFLNLVLVFNPGAAFSFLADAGGWQRGLFIVLALAASGWAVWLLRRHPGQTRFCLALSLIIGGALGNVIDRITIGAVVDFIDVHAWGWHWPAFNVADSAISCAAVLLIWESLRPQPAPAARG